MVSVTDKVSLAHFVIFSVPKWSTYTFWENDSENKENNDKLENSITAIKERTKICAGRENEWCKGVRRRRARTVLFRKVKKKSTGELEKFKFPLCPCICYALYDSTCRWAVRYMPRRSHTSILEMEVENLQLWESNVQGDFQILAAEFKLAGFVTEISSLSKR